jgi:transposase
MPVVIGVDPHKASHTAAAMDDHGQLLDRQRIPATLDGYRLLRRWAGRWPQRCWAVEGAHGLGRALAQRLVGDGEQVLEVPAKLAARVRVLSGGHGRKSDADDAVSVAVAAGSAPSLRQVGVEDQAVVLHLLTKRRQDLVAARTQTINRLHRLLVDLVPGGARRNLTARRAAGLLAQVAPTGAPAVTRWQLAGELVADVRQLEQRITAVEARIKAAVTPSKTSLLELFGVGPVLAATFLGEVGDLRRFPTKHHFAAHTGTAPLEASSGQVIPHRLSRAGDRKLNHALYTMAMVRVRRPSAGQAYYQRKLAEGKSQGSVAVPEAPAVGRHLPVPAGRSAPPAEPGRAEAGAGFSSLSPTRGRNGDGCGQQSQVGEPAGAVRGSGGRRSGPWPVSTLNPSRIQYSTPPSISLTW